MPPGDGGHRASSHCTSEFGSRRSTTIKDWAMWVNLGRCEGRCWSMFFAEGRAGQGRVKNVAKTHLEKSFSKFENSIKEMACGKYVHIGNICKITINMWTYIFPICDPPWSNMLSSLQCSLSNQSKWGGARAPPQIVFRRIFCVGLQITGSHAWQNA